MAEITFKGAPVRTVGDLPARGGLAPDFTLATGDLEDVDLGRFAGKRKILNIVPSLDTSVCAASARAFNQRAGAMANTVVLNISADLPFAQSRFCEAEGLEHVKNLSTFRSSGFGADYGVAIAEGPLRGLMSRAVLVLDEDNRVLHGEQVPEIAREPDYEAALSALQS